MHPFAPSRNTNKEERRASSHRLASGDGAPSKIHAMKHSPPKQPQGWLDSIFGDDDEPQSKSLDLERVTSHKKPSLKRSTKTHKPLGLSLASLKSAQVSKGTQHNVEAKTGKQEGKTPGFFEGLMKASESLTKKKAKPSADMPSVIDTVFGFDETDPRVIRAKQDVADLAEADEDDSLAEDDGFEAPKGVMADLFGESTISKLFGSREVAPIEVKI